MRTEPHEGLASTMCGALKWIKAYLTGRTTVSCSARARSRDINSGSSVRAYRTISVQHRGHIHYVPVQIEHFHTEGERNFLRTKQHHLTLVCFLSSDSAFLSYNFRHIDSFTMKSAIACLVLVAMPAALAQQSVWGQCGGQGWTGATTCASGSTCVVLNPYYSQCQPGTASSTKSTVASTTRTTAAPPPPSSTSAQSSTTSCTTTLTISTASQTTSAGSGSASGTGPGSTLQTNYLWIRAVEDPNFHKYLQTKPTYSTGLAILDSYTTAGQFNIVNGQLVELIDNKGTLLYANVLPQSDPSKNYLPVSFSTSKNTNGTFAFSGDAVTWSSPGVARQNNAAWLVCANQQLFINLGAYDYNTPAGCADETIHFYNGATAVS